MSSEPTNNLSLEPTSEPIKEKGTLSCPEKVDENAPKISVQKTRACKVAELITLLEGIGPGLVEIAQPWNGSSLLVRLGKEKVLVAVSYGQSTKIPNCVHYVISYSDIGKILKLGKFVPKDLIENELLRPTVREVINQWRTLGTNLRQPDDPVDGTTKDRIRVRLKDAWWYPRFLRAVIQANKCSWCWGKTDSWKEGVDLWWAIKNDHQVARMLKWREESFEKPEIPRQRIDPGQAAGGLEKKSIVLTDEDRKRLDEIT